MGILHNVPFVLRDNLLHMDFVTFHAVAALYHVTAVHPVFQDAAHRHGAPQRAFCHAHLRILVFEPQPLLFVKGGAKDTVIVQMTHNGVFAHAVQEHLEDVTDDTSGLLVHHKGVFIVGVFEVAIGGKGTDVLSVAAFHIKYFPYLVGGLRTVVFVEDALDGYGDAPHILGLFVAVQRLMEQRDKADIIPGEPVIKIIALIAVIAEGTSKVFYNDAVHTAPLNIREHPLEVVALVIRCAGNAVVHIFIHNDVLVTIIKPGDMILNDCPLVGDTF